MIFKRICDIVKAGVNETLDKVESPSIMVKQYLRDIEEEILKAERALTNQIVLEKRHASLVEATRAQIAKRTRQAELAVDTGAEDLAKVALEDKVVLESNLAVYEGQLATLQGNVETLTEQLAELQEKYRELQVKKQYLLARAQAAKTTQALNVTLTSIDTKSAVRGFQRMEERVEELEAHAAASQRIRSTYRALDRLTPNTTLQDKVEAELAQLKASRNEQ
jgi:phage shock protein A